MSTKMTLEEIEALAKDATPGPWAQNGFRVESETDHGWANDGWILSESPGPQGMENAAYIAQLPRLLEICREQAARVKALEAAAVDVLQGWAHDVIGPIPTGSCMCGASKASGSCDGHAFCDDGEYYAKGAIKRLEKAIGTKK